MSILHRVRHPGAPADPAPAARSPYRDAAPVARVRRPVTAARMNRAWPATIVLIAVIVFAVFMALSTPLLAMALLVLAAGVVLLIVLFGATAVFGTTSPMIRLRHLISRDRS
jgi:hypothetical protein